MAPTQSQSVSRTSLRAGGARTAQPMTVREDVAAFNEDPEGVDEEVVARIKEDIRGRHGIPEGLDLKICPPLEVASGLQGAPTAVWAVWTTSEGDGILYVEYP